MKKLVSVLMALVLVLGITSFAFAAVGICVKVSVADKGDILIPYGELNVKDGIAEQYGYTVPARDHTGKSINGVTVLDVLVALHASYYGDGFTSENAEDYLYIDSNGWLKLSFGKEAVNSGFAVNNKMPNDGIRVESDYGDYYTGYSIDEAVIKDGDFISFFFYKDSYAMDYYTWFDKSAINVKEGDTVELSLIGYSYGWYSNSVDSETYYSPIASADVTYWNGAPDRDFGTSGLKTDENGKLTITFSNSGEWTFAAYGTAEDGTPLIPAWTTVKVRELTFWEKIVRFFKNIIGFFRDLFKR